MDIGVIWMIKVHALASVLTFEAGWVRVGCLNFLSIYKVSLARLQSEKVGDDVREMIGRLMEKDPMRRGLYIEWQKTIEATRWCIMITAVDTA
jgi:hypothetical protein